MADTKIYMTFANGKVLTAHVPASASAGTFLKLDKHGIATANSPDEVVFNEANIITDIFFESTAGAVEFYSNDSPTGCIVFAATNQASNAGRKKHNLGIRAGVSYRLKVVAGFPA